LDLRFTAVFVRQGQLPGASRAGESAIVGINQHAGIADAGLFRALISSVSNYLQDFKGRPNTPKYV
jgi:hypothetical protein